MKYLNNETYQAAEYPQSWQKINTVIGHDERPAWCKVEPPFNGINTRNNYLNIILSYIKQGKILFPEEIKWFIETGTYTGCTAMHFATIIEKVHTIEKYGTKITNLGETLRDNHYYHMSKQFPNIKMVWGESSERLAQVFNESPENKDQRAIILLDAHCGTAEVPLLKELEVIRQYSNIKNHFIMIDDGEDCGKENFPSFKDLEDSLLKINPNYKVEFTNYCRNVIVAY